MNRVENSICRIREKHPENESFVTLGVGCVIKHEVLATSLGWKCPNLIVTSTGVLTPQHLLADRIITAEFLVFEKKGLEVFELKPAAEFCRIVAGRDVSNEGYSNEQLMVISVEPLDKRGFLKRMVKKSSLQTTRPIECFDFQNYSKEIQDGIFCNVIREFGTLAQEFESRTYKFKFNHTKNVFLLEDFLHRDVELDEQSFPADQVLCGAVIFSKQGLYLGCLTSQAGQVLPAFVPLTHIQTSEEKSQNLEQNEERTSKELENVDENKNKDLQDKHSEFPIDGKENLSNDSETTEKDSSLLENNAEDNYQEHFENDEPLTASHLAPKELVTDARSNVEELDFSVYQKDLKDTENLDIKEEKSEDDIETGISEVHDKINVSEVGDLKQNEIIKCVNENEKTSNFHNDTESEDLAPCKGDNEQLECDIESKNMDENNYVLNEDDAIVHAKDNCIVELQQKNPEIQRCVDNEDSEIMKTSETEVIGSTVLVEQDKLQNQEIETDNLDTTEKEIHEELSQDENPSIEENSPASLVSMVTNADNVAMETTKEEVEEMGNVMLESVNDISNESRQDLLTETTLETTIEERNREKGLDIVSQLTEMNADEHKISKLDEASMPQQVEPIQTSESKEELLKTISDNNGEEKSEGSSEEIHFSETKIVEEKDADEVVLEEVHDTELVQVPDNVTCIGTKMSGDMSNKQDKEFENGIVEDKVSSEMNNDELEELTESREEDVMEEEKDLKTTLLEALPEQPAEKQEPLVNSDEDTLISEESTPDSTSCQDGTSFQQDDIVIQKDIMSSDIQNKPVITLEKPVEPVTPVKSFEAGEPLEPDDLLSAKITSNPKAISDLATLLDTEYQRGGVSSWYDLAELLAIPKEAYSHCMAFSKPSPTEDLLVFLATTKPQFSISDLKDALRSMNRQDIVATIDRYIARSVISDGTVIQGVIEREDIELLGELALRLDRGNQANWKTLARELDVPSRIFRNFGSHQKQNSALLMLKYLPIFDPDLTLDLLKDACKTIGLNDVVTFLDLSAVPGEDTILDILGDNDFIDELTDNLNEEQDSYPNWKRLGRQLNIPQDKFTIFEPSSDSSPTTMLLQIAAKYEPDITVDELILALVAMKRHDVIDMLARHFKYSDIRSILEENNCLPPPSPRSPQFRDENNESTA